MFHVEPVLPLYNSDVNAESSEEPGSAIVSSFSAEDVEMILRQEGWFLGPTTAEVETWMRDSAESLGPQVALHRDREGRVALTELLGLIFSYDATKILESKGNQAVIACEGARDVIRELAIRVLAGSDIDSQRLGEIIAELKAIFGSRGRKIFYPLRLALAGRTGEGELDRVILLLDRAARLPFRVPVTGTRERMLDFCAALR